ncbi:hypothetical protein AXG93_3789s1130 [Marchantia polymorpha subsp. ruderalis]|uniref:Uncharacterized protein n=1 Tax=Marchantia polymorpha subsp. ruderalis TaxID=1480154 RepID=A0A176WGA4_MARPO|nr:hypothetical protein AXG93_3789s1130 [Marchantia polymorpha subsp. ruderalis]
MSVTFSTPKPQFVALALVVMSMGDSCTYLLFHDHNIPLVTPLYRHRKPIKNPFARVAQVIVAACRKYSVELPHDDDLLYKIDEKEALGPANCKLPHTQDFTFLDKATVPGEEVIIYNCKDARPDPWKLCTMTKVEEVKLLTRLLPICIESHVLSYICLGRDSISEIGLHHEQKD